RSRMPGYTTYCKIDDVERLFENNVDVIDKAKITSQWAASSKKLSRMVRTLFEYIKPTDFEFIALLGLTFWDYEYGEDAVLNIAKEVRSEIMKELREYYEDRGISDYATRIGQLFCITMNCQIHKLSISSAYNIELLRNV
ncbi:hypothetical protein PMAYCL1PPCAC_15227, partial [Pristionchus mayeri]